MKTLILFLARVVMILALLLTLALSGLPPATAQARPNVATPAAPAPSGLIFVENAGQFAAPARFQVRGSDLTLWLTKDAIWLTMVDQDTGATAGSVPSHRTSVNVKLSFPGANPHPRLEPFDPAETHVSFFTGSDPTKWRAGVPVWGGVRYADLYPGVDLELTGEQGRLLPRVQARPGADLSAVRLRVEGADEVRLEGDLLALATGAGSLTWPLLRACGSFAPAAVAPAGSGTLDVTSPFAPAAANGPSYSDTPADLLYSTFLGGASNETGQGIAVDESGAAYLTGVTSSSDFPTMPGAFDTSFNGGQNDDAFVVKLNAAGSGLDYATFLGGSGEDNAEDIAVDATGAAYVTGWTKSADLPTTPGAYDTSHNGDYDAFVVKLNPAGSALVYATFLGGSGEDRGRGIAVDGSGAAYLTGVTASSDLPTTPGVLDTTHNGNNDAYAIKLNAAGSALSYATFLGGAENDFGTGVAVNAVGAAYVTGYAWSSDFPTTAGAFDASHNGGGYDAFVAKLDATGSALNYCTFLGGSSIDEGRGIAVGSDGAAYVTGFTLSSDAPTTPGAFDTSLAGSGDTFVARLNLAGSALSYATFLGGSDMYDESSAIAVGDDGAAYVTGRTGSSDFPTTPGAFDTSLNGDYDAFMVKVNAAGSGLDYATFLGGESSSDGGLAIAVDRTSAAYVTGYTWSTDLPTTPGAFDTTYNSNAGAPYDAFVAKLTMGGEPTYSISGLVTDAGGQGIPGVIVSAGAAGSALTNAYGEYGIGNLSSGTHTVAPRPLCSFAPVIRSVVLPPNATGQNFISQALLCSEVNLPLVLRNR